MSRDWIPDHLRVWIDARTRHHLSDAHAQMARQLALNPKKLGRLDNSRQEPWKAPLSEFIERLYLKRFEKRRPDAVMSIEALARTEGDRKMRKRELRRRRAGRDVQG